MPESNIIYTRRKLHGLRCASEPAWAQLGDPDGLPLSQLLSLAASSTDRLFLCGNLSQMAREYVEEPLSAGWEFARPYIHKFRAPVYRSPANYQPALEISVKLVGKSWLPGCEHVLDAIPAWRALQAEWKRVTGLPLLSTPSKTGQAFLWQNLPRGAQYPALPDDVAHLIRRVSPQHRFETRRDDAAATHVYDGRWMYASAALTDRLPIGEPRRTGGFVPYQPGWYRVIVRVPQDWGHIGLLPVLRDSKHDEDSEHCEREWRYPATPGEIIDTWVAEPELTLAVQCGWEILDLIDGYVFDKGRPLATWARKLIDLRETLRARDAYAGAAIREVLNHTIGSMHTDTYEREAVVSADAWRALINQHGSARVHTLEKLPDGRRRVNYPAQHTDRLSIYMPHWSATIWALERAWIAKHALQCPPEAIVEIRGDAIHADRALPFTDAGRVGQLRLKEVTNA